MTREIMDYDVVIVGGGPSGLCAAIRLAQLAKANQFPLKIALVEKGSKISAHILSGAILEPKAIKELLPDWETKFLAKTQVKKDSIWLMTKTKHFPLPVPPLMQDHHHDIFNYILNLDELCIYLGKEAESLNVDIFPGIAASEIYFNEAGTVNGIITNDNGIGKNGEKKANFQAGVIIRAKYTMLAEGCRGSLTKTINEIFKLDKNCDPQTYAIGIKELWEIDPKQHQKGLALRTLGWPLNQWTYGGSSIYHFDENKLALSFIIGLDYANPYLDPFLELQRFKMHPKIKILLEGGRCIGYGARALNEGGLQSLAKLSFPGGLIIGCSASFLNVGKLKGIHTAMKSGMIAAESVFVALKNKSALLITEYEQNIKSSWILKELYIARNIRPAFKFGLWLGLGLVAFDQYILRGRAPWTLHHHTPDNLTLKKAKDCKVIDYDKPDGKITFDKLTALRLANVHHLEDQPCHLKLRDPKIAIDVNYALYASPETRYCPALVYEILLDQQHNPHLQINAANCIHCKTCDIKDPKQNINWVPPEGGGGPNYIGM